MTLILDRDVDVLKTYLCIENEVCKRRLSKVRERTGQTDRHTDRCDRRHYHTAFMDGKNTMTASPTVSMSMTLMAVYIDDIQS